MFVFIVLIAALTILSTTWISALSHRPSIFRTSSCLSRHRTVLRCDVNQDSLPSQQSRKKQRIDEIMVSRSLAQDIGEAKALVMSGSVLLENGEIVTSSAMKIKVDREIRLKLRKNEPYVSRAGRKLAHAISSFNLSPFVENSICIDIGCSTGGFSDVLLQNNCSLVYAVDVGVSLLDWKIRNHPKVVVVEKQNARYLNSSVILHPGEIGIVVCDVSFISLRMVLPPSLHLCAPNAILCALIKPQFECRRDEIGEGGIVRDLVVRDKVVKKILDWFGECYPNWKLLGTVESPITGQDGNVEYVMVAQKISEIEANIEINIDGDITELS